MLDKLIAIAEEAGQKVLEYYKDDHQIEYKEDDSPLTSADLAANGFIVESLKKHFPDIPIISEEGPLEDYATRKEWSQFFLIDPIDGTKDFVAKTDEFTINIALVDKGVPSAGVVYAPALDKLYYAERGKGAFKREAGQEFRLPCVKKESSSELVVVKSRSHLKQQTKDFIQSVVDHGASVNHLVVGSSLKFCYVAEGRADFYPRIANMSEWDTAAAHAIVMESGANFVEFKSRKSFLYNSVNLKVPHFLCYRPECESWLKSD